MKKRACFNRAAPIAAYTSLGYSNMSTLIVLPQSGHAMTKSMSSAVTAAGVGSGADLVATGGA